MVWDGAGTFILTVLVLAVLALVVIYGAMEYQVRMLRTTSTRLDGGILFTSRYLTVGSRLASQEVFINAPSGRYAVEASAADLARLPKKAIAVVFPAVGLVCTVSPQAAAQPGAKASGRCTVTYTSSDAAKRVALGLKALPAEVVVIEGVPLPVAQAFQKFAVQLGLWVERVEHRIALEREAEQRQRDEAAAQAAVAAALQGLAPAGSGKESYSLPVSPQERQARMDRQIAVLRQQAGFKGSSAEAGADPAGKLQWYVELDPTGQVILQSGTRTFHGSLKGAKVVNLATELELGVRDALWTEQDSALSNFYILSGAKSEVRLAWKERLDLLIRSLR